MRVSSLLLLSGFVPLVAGYVSPFLGQKRPSFSTTATTMGRRIMSSSVSLLSAAPTTIELEEDQGLVKTIFEPGNGMLLQLGDIATVKYSCYLPDDDNDKTSAASSAAAPFAQSTKQKMVVGDGSMIDGWEKAIRTMRVGERSIVRVNNPNLAYGTTGVAPIIPPNAIIEMDIQILDATEPTANIDFDNLALDTTPTTAADIARAFEQRQAAAAAKAGPKLEGLEAWIAKAKKFYFFGLFEGETGQQAPWFLRPSITFPIAFAIVGLAFYVSYIGGAISERGAPTTDELDEIIVMSSNNAIITTLAANAFMVSSPVDLGM